ncbi:Molybdenum cofactor biosynthesis, MoeB [Cordyceps fumosorosea ARSEF 2679]|uniref:Ubiquitin-like 1-activating enzyme E1A n=1 Tax=Cordyceps fumosorosea (strain ARSEF 2679) TaxID=1081104 RepID=A0A167RNI1_CORFA|nr:Molybdenum cofactor biosynthesis, MoeB [Cordyceps fumosorosea ARSEF 2679]OAA58769.1 Molybdenum cofactor biosynthesis, MoeB [Cordyceps fumosorosea ARSEF 2679]
MDPEQQQTGAEAARAQAPNTSGEPQFDPSFIPQIPNSDAMAGILPGQSFISDPMVANLSMGNPSMMLPMMLANGQVPQQVQEATSISADEIALYDRQIRLWGMAAQAKIQNANILLITMRALANEVAKNLVLAGVKSITLLDSATVTEADLGAQFFQNDGDSNDATQSHVGRNRAEAAAPALRKLNPRVQVHVDAEGVKTKGPSYFASFDIVIATDLDPDSFNLINTATRINGKAFYAAGTHGMFGFIFSDLIEHDFVIERDAGNVATHAPQQETRTRSIVSVQTKKDGGKTIESVAKRELYSTWFLASDIATLPDEYTASKRRLRAVTPALSCLRALWEFVQVHPPGGLPATRDDLKLFTQLATQKHKALRLPSETLRPEFLRAFLQNLGAEVAPVAAVLGGQLAQDVINVLGQRQQPIQNTVIFDGNTMEGLVYALHPEGILGANLLSSTAADVNGAAGVMGGVGGVPGVPIGVNGLGMMDQGIFPPNGGGFPLNNGLGMLGLEQQRQQQLSQPQEGVQPAIPVQQPPSQQPVSAPEQPPQDPTVAASGQAEPTS